MKRRMTDILMMVTGSVLFALSVSVFSNPNEIAPGGASGLAILANRLVGLPVGTGVLLLNLPLLAAAWYMLSRRFAVGSAAAIVLSPAVMDTLGRWLPSFEGDRLLAALFGGVLQGLGIGLVLLRGISTGGTEIAAYLLQKRWRHLSPGRLMMAVDAAVVALSAVVFGELSAALYATVQVLVCSVAVDQVLLGRHEGRLILAVTTAPQAVCGEIRRTLLRGATVMDVRGGYTGDGKSLVLCAVSRPQLPRLVELVALADPAAFVMVLSTEQVMGEGFLPRRPAAEFIEKR